MNTTIQEGPEINRHVFDILTSLAQKGADSVTFESSGNGYVALEQTGRGIQIRNFAPLQGPLAESIIHWFSRAADLRSANAPIIRQGKLVIKLAGKDRNIEIVFIPPFLASASGATRKTPIVTVFFSPYVPVTT